MAQRRRSASTSRHALCAAALLIAAGRSGAAQSVRGEVVSGTTLGRLPYSTVTLAPTFGPRFSDDSGRFAFTPVPPGTYRLTVKHIGYAPFDTVLAVVAGRDLVVRAALASLAVELPPVTVLADQACTNPGVPDAGAHPLLARIFDQLRENAGRYRLLSDTYPFRYWVQRRLQNAVRQLQIDTVEYRSDSRWPYAPGRVLQVTWRWGRREGSVRLPNITDLAEGKFHAAHCFSFGGVERLDQRPHLRVDFTAAARLRSPDVNGTAWLDSATYELRRVILQLTRPERAQRDVQGMEVVVLFGEVLPSLSLPRHIMAVTTYTGDTGSGFEEQRFLRLEYVRGAPGKQ